MKLQIKPNRQPAPRDLFCDPLQIIDTMYRRYQYLFCPLQKLIFLDDLFSKLPIRKIGNDKFDLVLIFT